MESLVLIGIAMSYIGVSRPASSSEHHIAHFLEMKSIFKGEYGELHGTNVGMATCLVHDMYERFLQMDIDLTGRGKRQRPLTTARGKRRSGTGSGWARTR